MAISSTPGWGKGGGGEAAILDILFIDIQVLCRSTRAFSPIGVISSLNRVIFSNPPMACVSRAAAISASSMVYRPGPFGTTFPGALMKTDVAIHA